MSPAENTRWLEIVQTATTYKKLREEAVIAATRRITDIYPTRTTTDPAKRPKEKDTQRKKPSGEQIPEERKEGENEEEQEEG